MPPFDFNSVIKIGQAPDTHGLFCANKSFMFENDFVTLFVRVCDPVK